MSIQTFGPLSCGAGPIGQFAAKPGAPASAVAAPANPAVLSMVLRSSDMVFPLAMKSAPRAGTVQHPTAGHATEKMDSGLGLGTQPASNAEKSQCPLLLHSGQTWARSDRPISSTALGLPALAKIANVRRLRRHALANWCCRSVGWSHAARNVVEEMQVIGRNRSLDLGAA
jgi:hypothetical protein